MNMRAPEWLAAFVLAVFTHVALAVGFSDKQGALIESGPGDGGPIIIGSLIDSISGELETEEAPEVEEASDTEEVTESEDVPETGEISRTEEIPETEVISEAIETPEAIKTLPVEPVQEIENTQPIEVVKEAGLKPDDAVEPKPGEAAEPIPDAVLPPLQQEVPETIESLPVEPVQEIEDTPPVEDINKTELKTDEAVKPEPVEAAEPIQDAVIPLLPQETVEIIPQKPQPVVARTVKKKPSIKKKTATRKKKKKRIVQRGRIDSRRGGTDGRGRTGSGGKGLGGRALRSNYQGRVIAHLRRYKSYPKTAKRRGTRGAVRMKFTINSAGRVVNSRLVASSGSPVLDGGARATIRRANPFPPFPKGLGKKRMTFIVPIRFSIR